MSTPRVIVIGGGISGLAAACRVREHLPDADVLVLEAAPFVGGKLRTAEVAGVSVDVGAEAMLARRPEAVGLARDVGLGDALIEPLTTSARIWAGGAAHALPKGTLLGIPDGREPLPMLTPQGRARAMSEATAAELAPLTADVAVGALVRSRMGDEVVDRLVEPLLGGVYAGRADDLSLRATVPALFDQLAGRAGRITDAVRAVVDRGSHAPAAGPVFASLSGGLGTLPQRLAASGRFVVRTSTTAREIARTDPGFRVVCGTAPEPELLEADAVVVAVPAAKAARLLDGIAPAAATELAGIESASMAITTLAYRDVVPPPGSGLLVGAGEGFTVKAVTVTSQKWPVEADGLTLLRASVGRAGEAYQLQRDDEDMVALVRHELRRLLGIDSVPVDSVVTRWGGGLPQYGVGHVDRVARVRASVAAVPGLAVCGAAYDGVGIPVCIATGQAAADQVVAALAQRGQ
jgi:oxygen-dependent protoporphyrinogen oxidase